MIFRPCIDIHEGRVKQIVGSTLESRAYTDPQTNFISDKPPSWYASLYKKDGLSGGHIIMLGPGNEKAAKEALHTWPRGMQVGGGINADNAEKWLNYGASHVIVTSYVFREGKIDYSRLKSLSLKTGNGRLVLDLSCRVKNGIYYIVTDRWQKFSAEKLSMALLDNLSEYCAEFLIHAADVEGKISGIEKGVIEIIGSWGKLPVTYAGGIHKMEDIQLINEIGNGKIDFTVGSALDIFGGKEISYSVLAEKYRG